MEDKLENMCRHFLPFKEQKKTNGHGLAGYISIGCDDCPGNNTECYNYAKERRVKDRRGYL